MDIEMTEKKRKSPKFNAFDGVIILVLLLAVIIPVVLAIRAERETDVNGSSKNIVYTIRVDNIDTETLGEIQKGQMVTDSATGKVIGKLDSVSEPLKYQNYKKNEETGTIEISEDKSGQCYVVLTISASAVYNDVEGYTVQGERIAIGKAFDIRLPDFEAAGVCTDLHQ